MQESAVKEPPEDYIGESEKQDYQTPEIYELNSLKVDSKLPELRINSVYDTVFTTSAIIALSIELPKKISGADIFLFNNGRKKDMYSQVNAGEYKFRNIFLDDSVNNIIFFYRLGSRRSQSEKIVVIRQSNR